MKKCFLLVFISIVSANCYGQKFPWKKSSPEEQGMSSLTLSNGLKELQQSGKRIHSLLIIRNNHVVLDVSFYPFRKDYVHDLASVTKSITSLLVGIAIDKGFIKSEEEPIVTFFPDYAAKNDTLSKVTIKDLLNMSSGFQCSWDNKEAELQQMRNNSDWVEFMFKLPFASQPGEKFSYCSSNFYLLAEILKRATRMNCHEFARKYLFDVLQFDKTYWEENNKGVNHGWGDLHVRPYDLAKIGSLILQEGKWNGKQVISAQWIKKIQPLYYVRRTESYGYGWWLDQENPDEIQAMGRGGQRMFIFRQRNVVAVTTGGGYEAGEIDNLIVNSIQSYRQSENHHAELIQYIKHVQSPDTGRMLQDNFLPGMLNKTFRVERNDLQLTSFRFEKGSQDYILTLNYDDGKMEKLAIGMNNRYAISGEHLFGLPVALKSYWNNNKLLVEYNSLTRINLYRFTFVFDNDIVDVNFEDITNKGKLSLKGRAAGF